MICCKECIDLLHDFIDGSLGPEKSKALEEHLEDCPPCIAFLNTYKSTTNVCRETLTKIEIPDEVKLSLKSFIEEEKKQAQKNKPFLFYLKYYISLH